jgi:hypothetical protein
VLQAICTPYLYLLVVRVVTHLAESHPAQWRSVGDLAAAIASPEVTSVLMDMNGAMGYLRELEPVCPQLGPKLKVGAHNSVIH